jgi:hypothetical protein
MYCNVMSMSYDIITAMLFGGDREIEEERKKEREER